MTNWHSLTYFKTMTPSHPYPILRIFDVTKALDH